MSEITELYVQSKKRIDEWARSASHPLLRICSKIIRDEALKELQEVMAP